MHHLPLSIALLLTIFSFTPTTASSNNPAARVSIDCGSIGTSAAVNGQEWIGDTKPEAYSLLQIKGSSTTSTAIHTSADPVPHKTARISRSQFSYAFHLDPGQAILRLHFNPAPYKGFKGLKDLFNVEAGSFILLANFSASLAADALGVTTFVKEFCICIEENQHLHIIFTPMGSQSQHSAYAFINGIEIISIPVHLSLFRGADLGAQVIGQKSPVFIDNITALELIHRNTPKLDSAPSGDDFDDVLGMWATIQKQSRNEIHNHTWKKSVDVGFKYLIRIYFCELGLKMTQTNGVILTVLINERLVDTNIEIAKEKDGQGILFHRDYMLVIKGRKQEGKRDLLISLQSSNGFFAVHRVLKGYEIYKLSNLDNSLASPNAIPAARDSPTWIIKKLPAVLGHSNAVATVATAVIALINIMIYLLQKIWEDDNTEDENKPSARAERHCRQFSLGEIRSATKNFSDALLIGKGGFGKVYQGFIDNGQETVAIKRLKSNAKQGKHEFLTEIETLSQIRHINLVSLIGYCREQREMILVYEYMPGGTLADQLYKLARGNDNCLSLTWKQCLNICIGAARGLDYLHTGLGIIHRDVKTSNILLDENFIAKVSDFGLAKPEDRSKLKSHVSTKVKGTPGYLDPYYFCTRKLTRKSDTYAFGVVLLEVLCGRPAMDPMLGEDWCSLTKWAQDSINKGEVEQIISSSLRGEISPDDLKVFVGVAERCLHDDPPKRPTMAQVVLQLEQALEHQENGIAIVTNKITSVVDDACALNYKSAVSASTEEQKLTSSGVQVITPAEETNQEIDNTDSPAGKIDWRKQRRRKPLWHWADAFRNGLKLFKKKELAWKSAIWDEDMMLAKFDLSEIAAMTNNFSSSNKIGVGRYGSVYKAVLLTGQKVAIKTFSFLGGEPEDFKTEIQCVSRLHHRNIIEPLGYCIHERGSFILYEFMENGSLLASIFEKVQFQWSQRFKIILGVTNAVIYLHQDSWPKTIHRDIRLSNILLDIEMNPKLSGFDLARTFKDDECEVETRIAGTVGYLAPEYAINGILSDKADVYSFGIVVMEILSGKRHWGYESNAKNLTEQAWALWREGKALDIVDESLNGAYSVNEAMRCIQVSLLCTQQNPHDRPAMSSVLKMLLGEEELSLQDKTAAADNNPTISSDTEALSNSKYDDTLVR